MVESLKREERIRTKRDFNRLFSSGERIQSKSLSIVWSAARERKVGFVVNRRVGSAVERNRVKRLLRETYRRNRSSVSSETELVIIAKAEARGQDYRFIEGEFLSLIRRAGLMNDETHSHLTD